MYKRKIKTYEIFLKTYLGLSNVRFKDVILARVRNSTNFRVLKGQPQRGELSKHN